MKLTVDLESDSLYFIICDTEVVESEEVAPGVILDHEEKGECCCSKDTRYQRKIYC